MVLLPSPLRWEYGIAPRHVLIVISIALAAGGYGQYIASGAVGQVSMWAVPLGLLGVLIAAARSAPEERITLFLWGLISLISGFGVGLSLMVAYDVTSVWDGVGVHPEITVIYALMSAAMVVTAELFAIVLAGAFYRRMVTGRGGGGSGSTPEEDILSEEELCEGGFEIGDELRRALAGLTS